MTCYQSGPLKMASVAVSHQHLQAWSLRGWTEPSQSECDQVIGARQCFWKREPLGNNPSWQTLSSRWVSDCTSQPICPSLVTRQPFGGFLPSQLQTVSNNLPLCTCKVQFLACDFVLSIYFILSPQILTLKINNTILWGLTAFLEDCWYYRGFCHQKGKSRGSMQWKG